MFSNQKMVESLEESSTVPVLEVHQFTLPFVQCASATVQLGSSAL